MSKGGLKKALEETPAFVIVCLETTIEIGQEYLELFKSHGGEEFKAVFSSAIKSRSPRDIVSL